MSSETPKAELNVPEEAAPFRASWWDGSNHVAFEPEGVRLIVAAELERMAVKFAKNAKACLAFAINDFGEGRSNGYQGASEALSKRASELRGEV